ncbi:hypothetical protein [Cohnella sp. 56]|uniref:hypothetical protein n=1 Tax=Cohnella sp. 56 TaxID=3113722 RepID=UPI0030EA05B3
MKKRALLFFLIFSVSLLIVTSAKAPRLAGDGGEYLGMTVSFANHLGPDLTEKDIVKREEVIQANKLYWWEDGFNHFGYFKALNGQEYSYHFWAYSLASTFVYKILDLFNLNLLSTFQITNALLMILLLYWIIYRTKADKKAKTWLLLCYFLNPIWLYLPWTHPEIFSFVFLFLGLLQHIQKKRKSALLFIAIGSWQNPAIALVALYICLLELIDIFKNKKILKRHIFAAMISLSVFFPYAWYYIHYRMFSIIGDTYTGPINLQKAISLFIDPNMGLIVYSPFLAICLVVFIFKRNKEALIGFIILGLMALICSVQLNWNSGMQFINRYSVWMIPVVIVFLISAIKKLKNYKMWMTIHVVISGAVLLGCLVTYSSYSYVKNSGFANLIYSSIPGLYNPPYDVFVERALGYEVSDYKESLPIILATKDGVRKALINENTIITYTNSKNISLPTSRLFSLKSIAKESDIFKETNPNIFVSFLKGFYGLETNNEISYRWMSKNSKLILFNNSSSLIKELEFDLVSFYEPRDCKIYLNNVEVFSGIIGSNALTHVKLQLDMEQFIKITFDSDKDVSPSDVLGAQDGRPLSLSISNLSINS